jgi:RNA polymerase sigma factor (sigma-70 family)
MAVGGCRAKRVSGTTGGLQRTRDSPGELVTLLPLLRFLAARVRFWPGAIFTRGDLVNDAYLGLMLALPRFDSAKGSYTDFVIHHGIGAMRDAVRRAEHSRCSSHHKIAMQPGDDSAVEVEDVLLAWSVQDVITSLSPGNAVIVQHWTEGRPAPDLALELRISEGQVYSALRRLKEQLRHRLRSTVSGPNPSDSPHRDGADDSGPTRRRVP